jgi:hypothetical protein
LAPIRIANGRAGVSGFLPGSYPALCRPTADLGAGHRNYPAEECRVAPSEIAERSNIGIESVYRLLIVAMIERWHRDLTPNTTSSV